MIPKPHRMRLSFEDVNEKVRRRSNRHQVTKKQSKKPKKNSRRPRSLTINGKKDRQHKEALGNYISGAGMTNGHGKKNGKMMKNG